MCLFIWLFSTVSFLLNFLHYVVSFDFFPLCLFILIFLFSNVLRGGHVGQEKAAAKWLISSFFLIFWKEFWYVGSEKLVLFCQISYFDIFKGWYGDIGLFWSQRRQIKFWYFRFQLKMWNKRHITNRSFHNLHGQQNVLLLLLESEIW